MTRFQRPTEFPRKQYIQTFDLMLTECKSDGDHYVAALALRDMHRMAAPFSNGGTHAPGRGRRTA
jgi:hypothetical protein